MGLGNVVGNLARVAATQATAKVNEAVYTKVNNTFNRNSNHYPQGYYENPMQGGYPGQYDEFGNPIEVKPPKELSRRDITNILSQDFSRILFLDSDEDVTLRSSGGIPHLCVDNEGLLDFTLMDTGVYLPEDFHQKFFVYGCIVCSKAVVLPVY